MHASQDPRARPRPASRGHAGLDLLWADPRVVFGLAFVGFAAGDAGALPLFRPGDLGAVAFLGVLALGAALARRGRRRTVAGRAAAARGPRAASERLREGAGAIAFAALVIIAHGEDRRSGLPVSLLALLVAAIAAATWLRAVAAHRATRHPDAGRTRRPVSSWALAVALGAAAAGLVPALRESNAPGWLAPGAVGALVLGAACIGTAVAAAGRGRAAEPSG